MMFWWLLVACPKRTSDTAVRRDELLKQADAAWEERGRLGFVEASRPLLEAHGFDPEHPGVLWRIARWRVAEGMAAEDPTVARSSFAEARATGASCLELQSGFVERRYADGWGEALVTITPDRVPCVAWTAFAWVRWMEIQGGQAASLDLEPVDALVARVGDDGDRSVDGLNAWTEGLLAAVRPSWAGRDLEVARERLVRATELDRDAIVRFVDLYRVVRELGTEVEQASLRQRILNQEAHTPEDIRAQATLDEGTPASEERSSSEDRPATDARD